MNYSLTFSMPLEVSLLLIDNLILNLVQLINQLRLWYFFLLKSEGPHKLIKINIVFRTVLNSNITRSYFLKKWQCQLIFYCVPKEDFFRIAASSIHKTMPLNTYMHSLLVVITFEVTLCLYVSLVQE